MNPPVQSGSSSDALRPVVRWRDGRRETDEDRIAVEEPLEIRTGDEPLAVTMRTPGHDADLAAGFCLTEGVVGDPDDIDSIEPCDLADYGNVVVVRLSDEAMAARAQQIADGRRELYLSSSCGLCGKQTLDRIQQRLEPPAGNFTIPATRVAELPDHMRAAQATFERTGGLHAAALFDPDGRLMCLREDVGRHNAVDKLIGARLMSGALPADPGVLMVSGRTSFEILQKAAAAGIACVAAVSAPSSLAVDFAARMDMTLVGFLRSGRMNIYHDRTTEPRIL